MNKQKIIALRKLIPIPLKQAGSLLEKVDWNVEKASTLFQDQCVIKLEELTGYSSEVIRPIYLYHQFDFQKTASQLKRMKEDESFDHSQLIGLTKETFDHVQQFRVIEDHEGLISALLSPHFEEMIQLLYNQLELPQLAETLLAAKNSYVIKLDEFKAEQDYQHTLQLWEASQITFLERLNLLERNFYR